MDFLPEHIEQYVSAHTELEPKLLAQLNRETWQKVLIPRMLSGHVQGRVLSMLSHMIQPKNVLEIGTYTGYSALCFCEGMTSDGELHTIDINEELKAIQDRYFEDSGYSAQIHRYIGNAREIIEEIDREWDLVFIDADKSNYINYYEQVLPRLRKNGFIIFDNVLWSGKVAGDVSQEDEDTQTLDKLNKLLQTDGRGQNVLFPVRDGLMIVRKV